MHKEFPHTVSYNRFVERQAQVGLHETIIRNSVRKLTRLNVLGKAAKARQALTKRLGFIRQIALRLSGSVTGSFTHDWGQM